MADFNLEDFLVRRGVNPNRIQQVRLNPQAIGNNFNIVGEIPLRQVYRPNFILGESGPLRSPNMRLVKAPGGPLDIQRSYLDMIYPKGQTKNIAEEVGEVASKVKANSNLLKNLSTAGRTVAEVTPYVGDIWDIQRGISKARNGHPIVGTGQALLGTAGLAANVFAPGAGTLAKIGIKAGAKSATKAATKGITKGLTALGGGQLARALNKGAKLNKSLKWQAGTAIIPELFYRADEETEQPTTKIENNETGNGDSSGDYELPPMSEGMQPIDSMEDFINNLVATNGLEADGVTPLDVNAQPQDAKDIQDLLDYYNGIQVAKQPYLKGLQEYIDNYKNLQEQAYLKDVFHAGMANYLNNPYEAQLIGRYNPAEIEATRLDLLNKLAGEQIGQSQGVYNVDAIAKLAERSNLPLDIALADPNTIKTISSMINAQTTADARKYVADQNARARLLDTYLDGKIKDALNRRNLQEARVLQEMKNRNRLQTTYLGQIPWVTDYNALNSAMEQFGYPIIIQQPRQQAGQGQQPVSSDDLF